MSLSVIQRPRGGVFNTSTAGNTGVFTDGSAVITRLLGAPATGVQVYISNGQAQGIWYAVNLSGTTFTIRENSNGSDFVFYGSGTFTYYETQGDHNWNAVHLPIVFKLKSDLWPTNSVDTARTVSSFANDNGFVKLTLSGALLSSLSELEFVKITGIQEAGVYQIITWYSTSVVTISLPYYTSLAFGGASVQYYYNNYRAKIRLYAGLTSSHAFGSVRPYTLVCEKEIVPDSTGVISYNCNEDLKAFMSSSMLTNDLISGALQNNLNAFTMFYITYAEAYDYSAGGYGLLDFVGSYTSDSGTFEGYAVNASLPFKNLYSGYMSEYIYGGVSTNLLKFLTPTQYPVHAGNYFDISWINQYGVGTNSLYIERYKNGTLVTAAHTYVNNNGVGIYRQSVSILSDEDRIDVSVFSSTTRISEIKTITVDTSCYGSCIDVSWLNYLGGFDYWRFKSLSDYGTEISGTTEQTKNITTNWPKSYGPTADTIRYETGRASRNTIVLRAENLTSDQVQDLFRLKTSPLVQIVNSTTDKRTIIPDKNSFVYYQQINKLHTLTFNVSYTDENPVQSL